jgi:hypothetical protein
MSSFVSGETILVCKGLEKGLKIKISKKSFGAP